MGTYDNGWDALHDPMFDRWDALEIKVLGFPVAWTVDDDVYIDTGNGYTLLGQLEWEDNDDPTDDFGSNKERLREYVISKLKNKKED